MRYGKFFVHRSEMSLVSSCIKYLGTYVKEYFEENAKVQKDIEDVLSNVSLFCVVWSIGAALEESSRKTFHLFLTELIRGDADIISKYDIS